MRLERSCDPVHRDWSVFHEDAAFVSGASTLTTALRRLRPEVLAALGLRFTDQIIH
jgi:hypothetical protein